MLLIIGLGNPGKKYEGTRHNVGQLILNANIGNAEWSERKKLNARVIRTSISGHEVVLAMPTTYMNESGIAANKLAHFYKIKPNKILVIHDDIDLRAGKYKLQFGRGAAGHHGVESIMEHLNTKSFWRLRIGAAPARGRKPNDATPSYVLKKFSKEDQEIIDEALSTFTDAEENWIKEN